MIQFTKMTAAGNDFILLDNRVGQYSLEWGSFARTVCDRRYGIGADGLLVLEHSTKTDFKMLYFNADGSSGGMCGNGGRCAAAFVMSSLRITSVKFESLDHHYMADQSDSKVKLKMKDPTLIRLNSKLTLLDLQLSYHFVDTGAPHVVIFHDELPISLQTSLANEGIDSLGRAIRFHSQFTPAGTNVNIVREGMNGSVEMRTYERGVEAETLACGTGAVACSIVSVLIRGKKSPIEVKARSGEILRIYFQRDGEKIVNIYLEGSAHTVFTGEITYEEGSGIYE